VGVINGDATRFLQKSRVGLLTTYRRTGEPVTTPVSIAVRAGGVYFASSATSGKARRLVARADVTLAPSTVGGRPRGPATSGQARLLRGAERRRVRRLLQPAGPLFWSYLLYRIRGHRVHVYEIRFTEPARTNMSGAAEDASRSTEQEQQRRVVYGNSTRPLEGSTTMSTAQLYQAVHLTARASALLFAGAQATSALGPRATQASRLLYLAFLTAHATHFAVVARYAKVNSGRNLFPGGRDMNEVGGWATVVGIFTSFSSLAVTGWAAGAPRPTGETSMRAIGQAATWLIAAMFVGVYLGQVPRSPWYAVPATAVAGAVTANVLAQRLRHARPHTRTFARPRPSA
jgi:PPOX class probable F420-dependent enzyme